MRFSFSDGAEGVEQFAALGGVCTAIGIGSQLFNHVSVYPGVLADVERVQMKAERAHLAQQGTDVSPCQPLAAVGQETVPYQQ